MGTAAAIVGGSVVSGILGNSAANRASAAASSATAASIAEQRRQFDLNRSDTEPYRQSGVNALNAYNQAMGLQGETGVRQEDAPLPAFQDNTAPLPEFQYGGIPLPEFNGGDRFKYNLEGDAGYRFARDEAIKAANRGAATQGQFNSGNRLAAIADRVTGVAQQYANDAFNRQMGESVANYGRDVNEYNLGYNRANDLYGRELTKYGLDYQKNKDDYNRNLTKYGLDYQQNQDTYGRGQNYLNRLQGLSGMGQTSVSQSGAAGANMANSIGNILSANAAAQGSAAQNRYSAINNAIQGGASNFMLYNYLNPPKPET